MRQTQRAVRCERRKHLQGVASAQIVNKLTHLRVAQNDQTNVAHFGASTLCGAASRVAARKPTTCGAGGLVQNWPTNFARLPHGANEPLRLRLRPRLGLFAWLVDLAAADSDSDSIGAALTLRAKLQLKLQLPLALGRPERRAPTEISSLCLASLVCVAAAAAAAGAPARAARPESDRLVGQSGARLVSFRAPPPSLESAPLRWLDPLD